ncbi:glutathione S-transferase family protein [Providencia vermicola]|uniref:Glutathione S-transferase family protein n=2 Tax=Providencia TaxID=586 RepID=A0AAI9I230_PROST|nr:MULTISPECIES: glutathione S-transferase family protein [Providencia]ELR5042997.1 glutathione S-transferase family protein [Providencia rettgeri]ELR5037232.1 glutathione S-transferase family protein [Providencia stuartii]ELR5119451.1 glutathione S-transferase family protein [Providencia stuartii]ELR5141187.1 glutathione S-transferase family protein [Providencia stuartii]ELR5290566.1 glutathione S-transferase family protein [Providencia stuartii]
MIELYTDSSPNGFKITILLEELALPYRLHTVNIDKGEHKQADFLNLNPHGRIPVITDTETGITLFESAAILLYLAEKTGKLLDRDLRIRWETIKWLQFHSASVGPMLGQRVHFEIFSELQIPEAIQRYQHLSDNALSVLNNQLQHHRYLAGEQYSIADIANFGWLHIARIVNFDFSRFEHLCAWYERIAKRPAVVKGITLPAPATGA